MRDPRFTHKAYAAALFTLVAGVVASMESGEWGWFARSGALVVVIGIILTSHQIIAHMHHLGRLQRGESQFNRDWAAPQKQHLLHDDHELRWRSEQNGLYMLIAGTLVWGFGDLLNLL